MEKFLSGDVWKRLKKEIAKEETKFVSGDGKVFESLNKAIVYAEKVFEKSGIVIAIEKKGE